MAITSSAKKEIKASQRKRVFNLRRTRKMRSLIKDTQKLASEGKKTEARGLFKEAQKAIDKAAKRGVIKKQTASRKKMVLARRIK